MWLNTVVSWARVNFDDVGRAWIPCLPNDEGYDFEGGHTARGPRRAPGALLDAEFDQDMRVVTLLRRVRQGDGPARAPVLAGVRESKPTIAFFQKLGGTGRHHP